MTDGVHSTATTTTDIRVPIRQIEQGAGMGCFG